MVDTSKIFEKDLVIKNLTPEDKDDLIRELYSIIDGLMSQNAENKKMNMALNESNGRLNEDLYTLFRRFKEIQVSIKAGDMEKGMEKIAEYLLLHKELKSKLPRNEDIKVAGASAPEPKPETQTTNLMSRGHYTKL
tara:strand:+ start:1791 stop:2198 length:408 start_codon:yes stop_codon:yes gene_type:complete